MEWFPGCFPQRQQDHSSSPTAGVRAVVNAGGALIATSKVGEKNCQHLAKRRSLKESLQEAACHWLQCSLSLAAGKEEGLWLIESSKSIKETHYPRMSKTAHFHISLTGFLLLLFTQELSKGVTLLNLHRSDWVQTNHIFVIRYISSNKWRNFSEILQNAMWVIK